MTKLSVLGILLVAAGLVLMMVAPDRMTCEVGAVLENCRVTGNWLFEVAGLALILVGSGFAVFGLRKRSA